MSNRPSASFDSSWILHTGPTTSYQYDSLGSRRQDSTTFFVRQAYEYDGVGRMKGTGEVSPHIPRNFMDSVDIVINANGCGYNADGQIVRGCGVSRVSYTGDNVVREHNGDWFYVVVPGLDDPVLIVKRGFAGDSNETEALYPVISDGRGGLIAVADTAGQLQGVILTPQYDAGIWNSSGLTGHGASFNPRRQATPGSIDTISSFRTRQFDPATGQWLQEDHAGLAGGVNLYQYNGNDPNSFSDPFGTCPKDGGGDGKTDLYSDCPVGSSGYHAYLAAQGNGGIINDVLGAIAACREDTHCEIVAGVGGGVAAATVGGVAIAAEATATAADEELGVLTAAERTALRKFFGQASRGIAARTADLRVTEGLTKEALIKYARIAERMIATNLDRTGVQAARLELIRKILGRM